MQTPPECSLYSGNCSRLGQRLLFHWTERKASFLIARTPSAEADGSSLTPSGYGAQQYVEKTPPWLPLAGACIQPPNGGLSIVSEPEPGQSLSTAKRR